MKASQRSGVLITTSTVEETVRAFVPHPLPPQPPLALTSSDYDLMERANRALGRLDGLSVVLPDTALFVYMYVRKEALLSSQIEGTQSSLSDLLLREAGETVPIPLDEVSEVSNYVAAIEHGMRRLRDDGFPMSLRLLREIHGVLLKDGRGVDKTPGEFRRSQNWIGGSRPGNATYVPPPPDRLMECLDPFERFLHDQPERTPLLIKAALAHAQFETIHPFLDGNGRLGRLLITLLLCSEEALNEPVLYLSLYFKERRDAYYDLLQRVRTDGVWEEWVRFFFEAVRSVAAQAVDTARSVLAMFEAHRVAIRKLGRAASSAMRVHDALKRHPVASIKTLSAATELSHPTVSSALSRLTELELVGEITQRERDRIFSYRPYVQLLSEGTEPLPR
jgi:Fic family protein